VRSPQDALGYVVGLVDVFARVCPLARKPRSGRGTAEDSIQLPGTFADLDVDGTPDGKGGVKTGAFPTLDAALEVAHAVLEPSLVVSSGGGLQPYWLLEHPFVFADDSDRERAARIERGFVERLRQVADELHGARIDGAHDLARVLRPPGSANGKGSEPRVVELLDDGDRRYTLEQLEAEVLDVEASPVGVDGLARPVEELLKLGKLGKLIKAPPGGDGSASAKDFAVACEAARQGCTDAEIGSLVRHARGGDLKSERADYIERTIANARTEVGAQRISETGTAAERVALRWGLPRDAIVDGELIRGVRAKLALRSGRRIVIPNVGDLWDATRHTKIVSFAARTQFPKLDPKEASTIGQLVLEVCGGEPPDDAARVPEWVTEFAGRAGEIQIDKQGDRTAEEWEWDLLAAHRELERELRKRPGGDSAERSAVIRGAELWLPRQPFKQHTWSRRDWDEFDALMLDGGYRVEDKDLHAPASRGGRGSSDGRIHRTFYAGEDV
jgi:hypothetical protein